VKLQGLGRQLSAKMKVTDRKVAKQSAQAAAESKNAPESPRSPRSPRSDEDKLKVVFKKFAKDGQMTSAQFSKMMRDSKLLNKSFCAADAELIYAKAKKAASPGATVSPGQKVPFEIFCDLSLPSIAEKRNESVDDLVTKLCASTGPKINATTTDNVRFHDDKSTYTGTSTQGGATTTGDQQGLDQLLDRSDADVRGVKT